MGRLHCSDVVGDAEKFVGLVYARCGRLVSFSGSRVSAVNTGVLDNAVRALYCYNQNVLEGSMGLVCHQTCNAVVSS